MQNAGVKLHIIDAEFYAKDYPDGLTDPTVDITFLNQKRDMIID